MEVENFGKIAMIAPPTTETSEWENRIHESEVTLISPSNHFEGTLEVESIVRMHGSIRGKLVGKPGSIIVLGETSLVEGEIEADTLWVEGFVRGKIQARTKILLRPAARVIGHLEAPSIEIHLGAYFEGTSQMEKLVPATRT